VGVHRRPEMVSQSAMGACPSSCGCSQEI
jgi:hypothetical protein